jgi:hypothetical protein
VRTNAAVRHDRTRHRGRVGCFLEPLVTGDKSSATMSPVTDSLSTVATEPRRSSPSRSDSYPSGDLVTRLIRSQSERLAGYRRVLEARSPDVTGLRLRELADDGIRPVRLWTARSIRCPGDALVALAHDEDPWVSWCALLNAAMPEAGLRYLCEREAEGDRKDRTPCFIVRVWVLAHPNTPTQLADQLRELGVVAESWMVRHYMDQRQASR